ncbi:MAG: hypothetical protein RLY86_4157 [Pseudomonadota bacterium]|jgi:hypothetical protein
MFNTAVIRDLNDFEVQAVSGGMEEIVVTGTRPSSDVDFIMELISGNGGGGGGGRTLTAYEQQFYDVNPDGSLSYTEEHQKKVDSIDIDWLGVAADLAVIASAAIGGALVPGWAGAATMVAGTAGATYNEFK